MNQNRVYFSVLNMGLGHAARSLPIMQAFLGKKWNILVGSNGRALHFLRKELPSVEFVKTPNYQIEYAKNNFLSVKLLTQIPRVLKKIHEEHSLCQDVVSTFSPDLIFSDHCYGAYHPEVPSIFLSHQVYFALPTWLKMLNFISAQFNFYYHQKYSKIIIPDVFDKDCGLLSGQLSRLPLNHEKYCHAGILSSFKKKEIKEDIDVLISISGPEPQRSIFESIVLNQVHKVEGKIIIFSGMSEQENCQQKKDNLKIYSHLTRAEMENYYNRAKIIVSRPGYSTLMELAELGKKALLIPTPGQTEQLYLARRVLEKKWFYTIDQKYVNLVRDIKIAKSYSGLFLHNSTPKTIQNIWNIIADLK